jgi:hypothetical protein
MTSFERLLRHVPDDALMRAERLYGAALERTASHPVGRVVVRVAHRAAAKGLGKVARATGFTGDLPPVAVAKKTMTKFFLPILDEDWPAPRGSSEPWTFEFTSCPYGLTAKSDGRLCHAIMNLEEELVRQLGGELVIEERIAEGASRCRFTVKSSPP